MCGARGAEAPQPVSSRRRWWVTPACCFISAQGSGPQETSLWRHPEVSGSGWASLRTGRSRAAPREHARLKATAGRDLSIFTVSSGTGPDPAATSLGLSALMSPEPPSSPLIAPTRFPLLLRLFIHSFIYPSVYFCLVLITAYNFACH